MTFFSISTYFSVEYLAILLPVSVLLYAFLPQMPRRVMLLLISWFFFFFVSGWLVLWLLFTTITVYSLGLLISKLQKSCEAVVKALPKEGRKKAKKRCARQQQLLLVTGICLNLGVIIVLKYSPFFAEILNAVLQLTGTDFTLEKPSFLLPIGVSFYTLQAIGYLTDVYRKKISADKNILRFSLFLSFFPLIMEGPICRYSETADALWKAPKLRYQNFVLGFQRILFGLMKKLVVADRLNLFIQTVFSSYGDYDGLFIAVAGVCYTIQLYMDFSGTMDLAVGAAQIFGIPVPENYGRPFFSKTISEFWKRWHITLGAWFRDYVFYPVSMTKPVGKLNKSARKRLGAHFGKIPAFAIALFCVWICNGLWHGAGWQYIFFGMYHYVLILGGNMIEPLALAVTTKLRINRLAFPYRLLQMFRTTVLVCIGELFFRADSLDAGMNMFTKIFTDFSFSSAADLSLFQLGADIQDFIIVAAVVVLVLIIGIFNERKISIREKALNKHILLSFALSYALTMIIVIFGAYGDGYTPVDPIYAGF